MKVTSNSNGLDVQTYDNEINSYKYGAFNKKTKLTLKSISGNEYFVDENHYCYSFKRFPLKYSYINGKFLESNGNFASMGTCVYVENQDKFLLW
jgi:hypothetical protein